MPFSCLNIHSRYMPDRFKHLEFSETQWVIAIIAPSDRFTFFSPENAIILQKYTHWPFFRFNPNIYKLMRSYEIITKVNDNSCYLSKVLVVRISQNYKTDTHKFFTGNIVQHRLSWLFILSTYLSRWKRTPATVFRASDK